MVVTAIVVCEVGFWVVLAAGLLARYGLRRPRLGAALLVCVPLVDLALLAFTALDLRGGTEPRAAHGLAAVYLGFSVAFGHRVVRWADARVAHRVGAGPAPASKPRPGTAARARWEWADFGRAALAAALSAGLVVLLVAVTPPGTDTAALTSWFGRLGGVLVVWLVGWPVWESVRVAAVRSAPPV